MNREHWLKAIKEKRVEAKPGHAATIDGQPATIDPADALEVCKAIGGELPTVVVAAKSSASCCCAVDDDGLPVAVWRSYSTTVVGGTTEVRNSVHGHDLFRGEHVRLVLAEGAKVKVPKKPAPKPEKPDGKKAPRASESAGVKSDDATIKPKAASPKKKAPKRGKK